jgi:hypothetical protein
VSSGERLSMSAFRSGKLIHPRKLVKTSPHGILRAQTFFQAGHAPEWSYVKLLPASRRYVEAVCAWIGREMGLPMPEPLFVEVAPDRIPLDCAVPDNGGDPIHFATKEIPQAKPLRRVERFIGGDAIHPWPSLVDAMVYDHLIGNQDRSDDNLLVDGHRQLWLIDHDRALGGLGERLFSDPYLPSHNFLMEIVKEQSARDRLALRQAVLRCCAAASHAALRVPYASLKVPETFADEAARFLRSRAEHLAHVVLSDLGVPDLFTSRHEAGATAAPSAPTLQ